MEREKPKTAFEIGANFYSDRMEEQGSKMTESERGSYQWFEALQEFELAELKLKQLIRRERHNQTGELPPIEDLNNHVVYKTKKQDS